MTRVLIALGGNALTSADGQVRQEDQLGAVDRAVECIADVAATGAQVLLTHGNGPQVGNLLVKNELAAHVVPPVSLDWCGAQTQGTIGFILVNALERAMAARGLAVPVAAVVTRTLVDAADRGFVEPTKPVGRFLPEDEAKVMIEHGQCWRDLGRRGWRRVVASPEPLDVLDAPAVLTLLAAGYAVVAAGGGGIPVVRGADGSLHGVEAVIDKDLAAAVLARVAGVERLVIATDVDAAWLGWGTDQARPLGAVSVAQLRRLAAQGHFGSGSMGPKVEAACRFVEGGGELAAIAALDRIADAAQGRAGTVVTPG
ncbi:MAG TPA: carbamate kinase [Micromonosporaceae bacterium]|nr:carbamate kinase [Micromonosporaceae bacterium]